ncbi:MAG: DNA-3-methyladenine glycosylase I [Chitinivibrionales bacterium]|nr:DNA-3-methyladenine glycosylase I [Chitinivibrionales bacterium]
MHRAILSTLKLLPKRTCFLPKRSLHKKNRCSWAGDDPAYIAYHDNEWGIPVHDDTKLFEMLVLEGFQAGLSWITILKKRDNFRKAFSNWNWNKVARYTDRDIERLMKDKGIIRNRLKIQAAINNAQRFIEIRKEFGSFDTYMWQFTNNKTFRPEKRAKTWKEIPARTKESDAMSKDLKKRGFSFVGPVICYAHMQAVGMVDDHIKGCWRCSRI